MINREEAMSIATKLNSISNRIYWDNDLNKWYLDSEEVYDNINDLIVYFL